MSEARTQFGIVRIGNILIGIELLHFSEVFHAEKEEPLPQSSGMLRGGVKLRGQLIPVLALDAFGRLATDDPAPMLGVILEHNARLLAFLVDEVVGITAIAPQDIQTIKSEGGPQEGYFESGFHYDGRFASILNVRQTMQTDGVFTAAKNNITDKAFVKSQQPVMIFEAGGTCFCLPAVEIYAAIPKRVVERTALTSGPCLGEITYHDRRIPVICPVQTFGLGKLAENAPSEIVALRFPGDLVLGLAVEAIHQIGTIASAKQTTLPLWIGDRNFIDTVYIQPDDTQLFSLDLAAIHAAQDLAEIATFSKQDDIVDIVEPAVDETKATIRHVKERYIVVEAPHRAVVPLSQVNRIVQPPDHVTAPQNHAAGFEGFFNGASESIALFDLPKCLGRQSKASYDTKVLLTGPNGHQSGFIVDRVLGIEVSEWREQPEDPASQMTTPVAQVGQGENAQILPILSLDQILERLTSQSVAQEKVDEMPVTI